MIYKIGKWKAIVLILSLFTPVIAEARIDYTVVPRLSIEGRYTDNYYNREKDYNAGRFKDDAYLATVSPGILLSLITRDATLDLDYHLNSRGYFIEREDDRFEYYNQRGSGILRYNVFRDFSVLLRDEIIKDEEITLLDETLTREERRLEYIRNIGGGELVYRYGEGRDVTVGYLLTIMDYYNNIVDDNKRHDFTGRITHNFNIRNIGEVNYRHSIVDYKKLNDPGQVSRDDLYEDEVRGRFTHHFTPRFSTGLNYGYIESHYDEPFGSLPIDYHVHDAAIESTYSVSRFIIADGRVGLFLREVLGREQYLRERGIEDDKWEKGLIYRAGIRYTYPTLLGMAAYDGGYGTNYINPERLEYYDYWRLSGDMTYHLIRDLLMLSGHGYYMVNRYPDSDNSRRDHIWNAGGGISYHAADWLLLSLEYNHTARNSNILGLHYVENSYLARVTISYRHSTAGRTELIRRGDERDAE